MAEQQQMSPLQERIERDVRFLIGDLQMQLIVLRGMLDMAQQPQGPSPQVQPETIKPNGSARPTVVS